VRAVLVALLAVVVVVGGYLGITYRRQIWSYVTHRKGGPTHTTSFQVAQPPPALHVAVAGDTGDSGSSLDKTAAAIGRIDREEPYQVLFLLGDNVYPNGDPKKLPATVFEPFRSTLASGTQLFAILGNHDVKDGNALPQARALHMPGRWWAKTVGDVLFVGLDSTQPSSSAQRAFLERTLANSDARWKIVALHHPPYSAGYQGSSTNVRKAFSPLFERYGVQLVLSGHDHDYQRSKPIHGVTYIVCGSGSGTRRTGTASFTAQSYSWLGFVDLAIHADRIVVQSVNPELRVGDTATISP
jgi:3',5'-cyclic AMP phosphodiesterase CpdA